MDDEARSRGRTVNAAPRVLGQKEAAKYTVGKALGSALVSALGQNLNVFFHLVPLTETAALLAAAKRVQIG
jgi:hypothetical protein